MKRSSFHLGVLVLLVLGTAAHGQQIVCEAPTNDPPGPRPIYPWQDQFTALTRIGNHWMPTFGDGNSMSAPFWNDQGTFFGFGSAGFEETWYVPRDAASGAGPLYRHLGGVNDHMDSPSASEPGYTVGLGGNPLGFPWTSALAGTSSIRRYFKSSSADHRTWLLTSPPAGYSTDVTWDSGSGTPRYGYQRFGNLLDQCSTIALADPIGTKIQNSKVRVGFNPIWGNAIGEITHLATGKQIVSHSIGDMVQSVIFYGGHPEAANLVNPTQSGGADCWNYGSTRRWAGSPVISSTTSRTTPKFFQTVVRPLNFCHNDYQGNDPWSPLAWRGQFRLTTSVGCRLGGTLYDDVIKVEFEAKKDADAVNFTQNPLNMNNVGWLLPHPFGDCRNQDVRIDVVNLVTGALDSTDYPACNEEIKRTPATNKGLRITSADGTFAVGFASVGTLAQLSVNFSCNMGCGLEHQRLIPGSFRFRTVGSSTWAKEDAFWVVGTPAEVLTRLQQLYQDSGSCQS